MEGPNGEVNEARGVYLEVIPERKLVFTDAFVSAWIPSEAPFMVGMIELSRTSDGGTLYRATARHWTIENREAHEKMGFKEGWTAAARQLEALFAKS